LVVDCAGFPTPAASGTPRPWPNRNDDASVIEIDVLDHEAIDVDQPASEAPNVHEISSGFFVGFVTLKKP
jgi:hypothetical protein